MDGNRRGRGWSEDHALRQRASPPHFRAKFAEFHAVIDIDKLAIIRGSLPPSKSNAVIRWATGRREALRSAFVEAMAQRRVGPIK
jgi:hypothetical protein